MHGYHRYVFCQNSEGTLLPMQPLAYVIAVLVFAGLGFLLQHERRQARKLVDRSKELERLSSELLRASRMKNEFLANVSHELRTPLNAIVGFVDLLREGAYGDLAPRQVKSVERIEASANHLRHLVDEILDLAKMAAGRLDVHAVVLNIRPFILDVASEVESLVNEKDLSLSLAMGSALPRIRTDPTHLRQILVNLLGNAVKYTERGTIVVRTRTASSPDAVELGMPLGLPDSNKPQEMWLSIQVADQGIGIAPVDLERIFEEFEQVDAGPRADSANRGTGLGLAISRKLAHLLGGDISVVSKLGEGSTFSLWLPLHDYDLAVSPQNASNPG